MFEAVEPALAEHAELERRLADPAVHADAATARTLGRRYAELDRVVSAHTAWRTAADDAGAAAELAAQDPDFAAELPALEAVRDAAAERLRGLLVPRDPDDGRDVILEVKAGEGGEESALFAGDLLRMYLRYAERRGWSTEVLDATESDLGGYKDVAVAVKARGTVAPEDGVWARLKYEGGVHRVQRVPVTESAGRIHTSAAGVLVLPEAEEVEVEHRPERPADRRLPLLRPGRAERQHHRLGGADHPRAHRHRRVAARTRRASCRTASRRCGSCGPACTRGAGAGRRRGVRGARLAGAHGRPLASGSAPTTTPRTGSATTAPATRRTTSTPSCDGDLDPVVQSAVDADDAARLAAAATR